MVVSFIALEHPFLPTIKWSNGAGTIVLSLALLDTLFASIIPLGLIGASWPSTSTSGSLSLIGNLGLVGV